VRTAPEGRDSRLRAELRSLRRAQPSAARQISYESKLLNVDRKCSKQVRVRNARPANEPGRRIGSPSANYGGVF
jgi:hypothetical protein